MLRSLPNSTTWRFRSPIQPLSLVLPPLSCMPTLWYFYPSPWYSNPALWYSNPSPWYFYPSLWYFHPSMVLSPRSLSGTFTPLSVWYSNPALWYFHPSLWYSNPLCLVLVLHSSLLLLFILNAHIFPYLIPYTRTAVFYSRML